MFIENIYEAQNRYNEWYKDDTYMRKLRSYIRLTLRCEWRQR